MNSRGFSCFPGDLHRRVNASAALCGASWQCVARDAFELGVRIIHMTGVKSFDYSPYHGEPSSAAETARLKFIGPLVHDYARETASAGIGWQVAQRAAVELGLDAFDRKGGYAAYFARLADFKNSLVKDAARAA